MMRAASNLLRLPAAVLLLAATMLAGCATPPTDPEELAAYKENNDPLEPMNRYFFEVNYGLDELLIKPIAAWYYVILPTPVEHGVHNVLRNLERRSSSPTTCCRATARAPASRPCAS